MYMVIHIIYILSIYNSFLHLTFHLFAIKWLYDINVYTGS